MSDPQPHHLKPQPKRAEPWQPDRPGSGDEQEAETTHGPTADRVGKSRASSQTSKPADATTGASPAVSPEAAIPRDPQTGQALNDESLTSGKDSEQSDGRSGSMHLPPS